jgi:glutamate synthase domain-containing protein 2
MFIITTLIILVGAITILALYNMRQQQHSVLRLYPIIGMFRYFFEMMGPEMRQYITDNDTEGKPFSRYVYKTVVKMGKYMDNITGFGSQRDFDLPGWYIKTKVFCTADKDLACDNTNLINTKAYTIKKEWLLWRRDSRIVKSVKPWLLQNPIIIGQNDRSIVPWKTKNFIGMSAMSYGSLGDHAIETLAHGLAAAGAWVNTGEGGLAPLHLVGGGDVIFQFGPGLFGARSADGLFDSEVYKKNVSHPQVRATEIKLHQGAKVKGGILPKEKITAAISAIRGIPIGVDCISPNTYPHIHNAEDLGRFIIQCKSLSKKPVGIKIVVGDKTNLQDTLYILKEMQALPNFITIDGSEGGSGAAPQDMADILALPLFNAIAIADTLLRQLGIRDTITLFASGKLVTADQIVIAMALGANCVNIARGLMMQLGCIQALKCHTNKCPVGVATQDPKLQNGLVIEEKKHRVTNYIVTLREHVFKLIGTCHLTSPSELTENDILLRTHDGELVEGITWKNRLV